MHPDLLDLTSDDMPAPLDVHTEAGLAHAARGDWHAAANEFAAALWDAESSGGDADARDARLAVALTNLGQARAYLGALDEAATLLARSVTVRGALVERGTAARDVAARGLVDLAAVQAAAGDEAAAIATLRSAERAADGGRHAAHVSEGLALLDAGSAPAALPWLTLDDA